MTKTRIYSRYVCEQSGSLPGQVCRRERGQRHREQRGERLPGNRRRVEYRRHLSCLPQRALHRQTRQVSKAMKQLQHHKGILDSHSRSRSEHDSLIVGDVSPNHWKLLLPERYFLRQSRRQYQFYIKFFDEIKTFLAIYFRLIKTCVFN